MSFMASHLENAKLEQHQTLQKTKHCCCPGEYCSLIHALDRNRDLVTSKVIKSKNSKPKRNELHGHGRDRAYRILKRILTKDELFALEDSGDITRLRIACRIRMGASKSVPRECIERSKQEHRVAFLELQDTEDPDSFHVWGSDHRVEIPSSEASYEFDVCEMCFHTYRLLTQVRCLQDEKFRNSMLNSSEDNTFGLSQLLNDNGGTTKTKVIAPILQESHISDMNETKVRPADKVAASKLETRRQRNQTRNDKKVKSSVRVVHKCKDHSQSLSPTKVCSDSKISPKERKSFETMPKCKIKTDAPHGNAGVQQQIPKMKSLRMDDGTVIPYIVLGGEDIAPTPKLARHVGSKSKRNFTDSKCNLIVCHDLFETQERMQIYLSPFVERHKGHKILLWNYPGQAYTTFPDKQRLNNEYHSKCLEKLVDHVGSDGTNEFKTNEPFFILGHGQGGAIACLYAKSRQQPTLKGLILINALSFVDTHFASVIHDCRNVFHCSPEERPDLPLYFYSRFLFSDAYLQKTTTPLALNLYSAVHNPITLKGRIRLCEGVLDNIDLRGIAKDIFAPIISIHGDEAGLVRPLHASTFLQDRDSCSNIYQALYRRGGKRTVVVMTQGGHELLQERKKTICVMIEQILTGNVAENKNNGLVLGSRIKQKINPASDKSSSYTAQNHLSDFVQTSKTSPHETLCSSPKKPGDKDQDCCQVRGTMRVKQSCNAEKPNFLIDPENPAFERQKNKIYKPGTGSMIYPEVGEQNKSQEYMSWRLRRNRKRLSRFQRAARVIQNSLRVYMAKTMMSRLKRRISANNIQRCYRGMQGRLIWKDKQRELWAARFVQKTYRGAIGRKTSYYKRIIRASQICIARVWRGHVARKRTNVILLHRNSAATNFQSLWRRYLSISFVSVLKLRRNFATVIQRTYRGHLGRIEANIEREKYLFSRSQSKGIEIGRQMLAEHKTQAIRLQSELNILEKENTSLEERVHQIVEEINSFQNKASALEKSMQDVSLVEVDLKSSMYSSARAAADVSLREKKVQLDQEFSSLLKKISDRNNQLKSVETKLLQLSQTKDKKEQALKMLERKLVALLETQENELAEIRRRQELQGDERVKSKRQSPSDIPTKSEDRQGPKSLATIAPPTHDNRKTAQLMDSTETMMKFGFTSMTMTYFTALNMVRAMKSISTKDMDILKQHDISSACSDIHNGQNQKDTNIYTRKTQAPVLTWKVDHVIEWLKVLSLEQYEDSFRDGSIDGPFLCQLTDDDLMNVLGVEHKLHRKKILFGISQLQNVSNGESKEVDEMRTSATPMKPTMKDKDDVLPINAVIKPEIEHRNKIAAKVELPPSLDDLSRWVRNQKYSIIKDALHSMPSSKFDPTNIRVQFMDGIGTVYVKHLADSGFHLNKQDAHGNTLMHIAAQNGNLRIAKLIMDKGANPNHQNKQGQTPGHFAVAYQFFDFASWLFDENGGAGDDLIANIFGLGPYDGLSPGGE